MIVPMVRAFVACQHRDRDRLLGRLHDLGVLHIVPITAADAGGNGNGNGGEARLKQVEAALQVLRAFEPRGPEPRLGIDEAVREVLAIWNGGEAARARLDALHRELEQLRPWGDTRLDDVQALADAGVDLQVLVVPEDAVGQLHATLLKPLEEVRQRRRLVAAVGLDPDTLPKGAEVLPLPARYRHEVEAEAAAVKRELELDRQRLRELVWLLPRMEDERRRRERELAWARAVDSGLEDEVMYAVQGWLPADRAPDLLRQLSAGGLRVAVRTAPPGPDDLPPTLIRYRPWARPIDALFRILNMVPGYREVDASSIFMLAIPLFAGMIIGDAGYGLLFALVPLVARRATTRALGTELRLLLILFGLAAIAWGAITGVWFGTTPAGLLEHGGIRASLGEFLDRLQLVRGSEDQTRDLLIQICFGIGAVHLVAAHGRRLLALVPDPRAFAELGWCLVLAAMLGVIWILFFGAGAAGDALGRAAVISLAAGIALVAWFTHPDRPLPSRIGLGLAGSLLPTLSAFSDTLSYIRLMAVGIASYYLGSTFNLLAAGAAQHSWLAGALVLLTGHALNIALIFIAIFAHGVRLNVLEFSSNAGIQWAGYAYQPFADRMVKEPR